MIINTEKIKEFDTESKKDYICHVLTLRDNSILNNLQIVIKKLKNHFDVYCKDFIVTYNFVTKKLYTANIHKFYRKGQYYTCENSLFKILFYPHKEKINLKIHFENTLIFENAFNI